MNILSKYVNFAYSCPLLLSESGRIKGFAELTVPSEPFGVKSILSERSSLWSISLVLFDKGSLGRLTERALIRIGSFFPPFSERRKRSLSKAPIVKAVSTRSSDRRKGEHSSVNHRNWFYPIWLAQRSQKGRGHYTVGSNNLFSNEWNDSAASQSS